MSIQVSEVREETKRSLRPYSMSYSEFHSMLVDNGVSKDDPTEYVKFVTNYMVS